MAIIELKGITYKVISTTELKNGRKELKLQRINGRRIYFVVVYENGSMSEVV